jgi:hypothetical protein
MRDIIASEIEKRRAELKQMENRRAVLQIELDLLEDLLARAPEQERAATPPAELELEPATTANAPRMPPSIRRRERPAFLAHSLESRSSQEGPSLGRWRVVLEEAVKRYPETVHNDEIADIQRRHGEGAADRTNVRSHLWAWEKKGLYERVAPGTYRATEKAAAVVGIPLGRAEKVEHQTDIELEKEPPSVTEEDSSSQLFAGAA